MNERKKGLSWFRYILLIGFLFLLVRNVEPLKKINEMYSAPWYLVMLVSVISVAVGITLGFREGKVIRREALAKRKDVTDKEDPLIAS